MSAADPALRRLLGRLEISPRDRQLLSQALTHRSAAPAHNERLEFLGDAVLELAVTHWLYRSFPQAPEGELTRLRARLVRKETLASIAREIDLGPALTLGGGELKSGGRQRDGILADALEALLGAIYLQQGLEVCAEIVERLMRPRLDAAVEAARAKDPKTRLQEWLQSRGLGLPEYEVTDIAGADHQQMFQVECHVADASVRVTGRGRSRRGAEQDAAERALASIAGTRGRS